MNHRRIAFAVVAFLASCGGEQSAPPNTGATPAPTTTTVATAPTTAPTTASTESAPPPTPKPAMIDMQKKASAAVLDAFNSHDAKKLDAVYATDAVVTEYGPGSGMDWKGRDAIEKHVSGFFTAFPDLKMGFVRVLTSKNVAVCQWVWTGTNTGEMEMMPDMKPTKKAVGMNGVSAIWFGDDGLVTKEHVYMDVPTMLGQLGISKEKARAPATLPSSTDWVAAKDDDAEKKNVAVLNTQLDSFNKHDMKAFGETLADDTMQMDYSGPSDGKGKKGVLALLGVYTKAFPDIKLTLDNVWGVGDYVIDEGVAAGTQTGPLGPVKPTKKAVAVHFCEVNAVKDGKIAKTETYMNSAEMLDQLGLLPKPKAAPPPPKAK